MPPFLIEIVKPNWSYLSTLYRGSGGSEKLRKCHVENFRYLTDKIPKKIIEWDMNRLSRTSNSL